MSVLETMLSPVPKNGATFRGTKEKIDAAIARFEKLPKRNADVADMLQDIRKIHSKQRR